MKRRMLGQLKAVITKSPMGLASMSLAVAIVWGGSSAVEHLPSTVGTDPDENHFAEALLVTCVAGQIAFYSALGSLLGIVLSLAGLLCGERKAFGFFGIALNGTILTIASKVIHTIFNG